MSISFASATELIDLFLRREIKCVEALNHFISRNERLGNRVNAIVASDVEAARERAQQADATLANNKKWGPLHGLPMTVKDSLEVVGMPTTSGAEELENHRPSANAAAVQRVVDAGAVVFGKTNLPMYALDWQSYNKIHGTANNPWDPRRTPGGSSGGAAAALAAGLTPLEIGSDIAGSIRVPSHFCGVYGHKPSFGIVSPRGHIPGPPGTLSEIDLNVVGPMARSPDDLELALGVMAGPSELADRAWRLHLPPPRSEAIENYRVAYWFDDPACPVDERVLDKLQEVVAALRGAGVEVVEGAPAGLNLREITGLYLKLFGAVFGLGLPSPVFAAARVFTPALRALASLGLPSRWVVSRLLRGAVQTHRDWVLANEARERLRHEVAAFFETADALLTPVAPTTAFEHRQKGSIATRTIEVNGERRPYTDLMFWISLATLLGLPATVAPVGLAADGLPVGIQIVGPPLEDRTTIDFARKLGDLVGGFRTPPGFD